MFYVGKHVFEELISIYLHLYFAQAYKNKFILVIDFNVYKICFKRLKMSS